MRLSMSPIANSIPTSSARSWSARNMRRVERIAVVGVVATKR